MVNGRCSRTAEAVVGGAARRYSGSVKLTIDLSPAQAERLCQEADRLGLAPEDLADVVDTLLKPQDL